MERRLQIQKRSVNITVIKAITGFKITGISTVVKFLNGWMKGIITNVLSLRDIRRDKGFLKYNFIVLPDLSGLLFNEINNSSDTSSVKVYSPVTSRVAVVFETTR